MATVRTCIAVSKLLNKSVKDRVIYNAIRTTYAQPFSDERVEMLREFFKRKQNAGPEKPTHRSTFLDWNYPAELSAFSKRIGENFVGNSLERALTQKSYILSQESLQKELGIDDPKETLEDNRSLTENGEKLTRDFVARYLRVALPCLPEEGIRQIRDHLLQEECVAKIVSNIGAEELILCTDFPTEKETRVSTCYALIGAIEESSGQERAGRFVHDFVIASLSGQDIQALVIPDDKIGVLRDIFIREGIEPPEPRLIAQAGVNTIIPSYRVGLYSEKRHIGTGDGESVKIAVENAALSVLWKLWGIPDGKFQFPFNLNVAAVFSNHKTNIPQSEWTRDKAKNQASVPFKI